MHAKPSSNLVLHQMEKRKITCNARMGSRELKACCALDEATMELLKFAMADLNLSARAHDRGFVRRRKHFERTHLRSDSVSLPGSAAVDLRELFLSTTGRMTFSPGGRCLDYFSFLAGWASR